MEYKFKLALFLFYLVAVVVQMSTLLGDQNAISVEEVGSWIYDCWLLLYFKKKLVCEKVKNDLLHLFRQGESRDFQKDWH